MRRALQSLWRIGLVVALAGCSSEPARHAESKARADHDAPAATEAEPSLFELDFPLTDAAGHERRLAEFAGGPLVVSMIYTSCKSVCPRITADLHALDHALPEPLRARTRFLLFSLDPEHDTPAALASYASKNKLDARWTLLAAGEDDMRTLAAVLGVRFRPDADGEIAHSAVIAVADAHGIIRHRQLGVGADPNALVQAIGAASAGSETAPGHSR